MKNQRKTKCSPSGQVSPDVWWTRWSGTWSSTLLGTLAECFENVHSKKRIQMQRRIEKIRMRRRFNNKVQANTRFEQRTPRIQAKDSQRRSAARIHAEDPQQGSTLKIHREDRELKRIGIFEISSR